MYFYKNNLYKTQKFIKLSFNNEILLQNIESIKKSEERVNVFLNSLRDYRQQSFDAKEILRSKLKFKTKNFNMSMSPLLFKKTEDANMTMSLTVNNL